MLALLLLAAALAAPPEESPEAVPFRVSIVPGLGIGANPNARVEGVAMGVISRAEGLDGVDMELALSWVDGQVEGLQASFGANVAGDVDGAQLTTGLNLARSVEGLQGGFGLNVAGGVDGVQIAPLNIAGDVEGMQLGLVNVGRDVDGLQLGLVNIARTSNTSIAPINLVGDGLHRVNVWASDSAVASIGVKFGSRHVYTLLGVGWVNASQSWWTFGGGFGVHLSLRPFWLEIDDSVWGVAEGHLVAPGVHNKLRAQIGIDLHRHFAPFVGASINTWVGDGGVTPIVVGGPSTTRLDRQLVTWPGVHAGVSF